MKTIAYYGSVNKFVYASFIGLSLIFAFIVFVVDKGMRCFVDDKGAFLGLVLFGILFSAFPILVYRFFTRGKYSQLVKWFFSLVIGYAPLISLLYCMLR
ncbi:MAG: hypothetical protein ACEPOW_01240 [Bacteroidales bacterium]